VLGRTFPEKKTLISRGTRFFMHEHEQIHIAQLIQQRLTDEGRTITWLCRNLQWDRKKWYRFIDNGQIDVNELYKISLLLHHDFFNYYVSAFNKRKGK
jgi:hypothetical protein